MALPAENLMQAFEKGGQSLPSLDVLLLAGGAGLYWAGAAVATVAAGVGAIALLRTRRGKNQRQEAFLAQCHQCGLSAQEQDLMQCIVGLAELKNPAAIFTLNEAFDRAVEALMKSDRITEISKEGRLYIHTLVNSLREKLGYQAEASDSITSSRHIPVSGIVNISRHGNVEGFSGTITRNSATELVVQPETTLQAEPGEQWLIRYCDGGSVWEFDTLVLKLQEKELFFEHCEHVRFINRRRYPRVPVQKQAMIAPFQFDKGGAAFTAPAFVQGELVEVAGPGLRVVAPLKFTVGDKALVIVHFDQDKVVQGLGRVRRCGPEGTGRWSTVVELMTASNAELAELSRQTTRASQGTAAATPGAALRADGAAVQEVSA